MFCRNNRAVFAVQALSFLLFLLVVLLLYLLVVVAIGEGGLRHGVEPRARVFPRLGLPRNLGLRPLLDGLVAPHPSPVVVLLQQELKHGNSVILGQIFILL